MFSDVTQNKISIHIIHQIRDAIMSGKLQRGDRLPAEKELIQQFGVSKHTLREALRALEAMGFLEIRKGAGGGPVVSEVDMETTRASIAGFLHFKVVSVENLSEVRKMIEPHLARAAARNLSSEHVERLASLNLGCRRTLDRGESLVGAREEIDFHILLAEVTGNPVLMLILDFVNRLLTEAKADLQPDLVFCEQVLKAHERIYEAIRDHRPDDAADAMYRHICDVEEALKRMVEPEDRAEIPRARADAR
jgi:GntR family transcriptional regulator, transcriptional repressor for pyruvate dehydrogenase complex